MLVCNWSYVLGHDDFATSFFVSRSPASIFFYQKYTSFIPSVFSLHVREHLDKFCFWEIKFKLQVHAFQKKITNLYKHDADLAYGLLLLERNLFAAQR